MVLKLCFTLTSRLLNTQANIYRSKLFDNGRCDKISLLTVPFLMRHTGSILSSCCGTDKVPAVCGNKSSTGKKPCCVPTRCGPDEKRKSHCERKKTKRSCSAGSKKGGSKRPVCGKSKTQSPSKSKCERKKNPCEGYKKGSDSGAKKCSKCGLNKPCECGQNIWPTICGEHKVKEGKTEGLTMEAVVFDGKKRTVSYRKDYPRPQIEADDDVIVKVEYAGVCGTDFRIISGNFPAAPDKEYALGHEISARIHEMGPAVKTLKKGQAVTIDPQVPCKVCKFCQLGLYHLCHSEGINRIVGIHYNGGWAQYVKVKDFQCQVLPEDMDIGIDPVGNSQQEIVNFCKGRILIYFFHDVAALCEPYADIAHAFDRAAPLIVGSKILLQGAGVAGVIFTTLLHHFGHRDVTVTDSNDNRLKGLEKLQTGYRLLHPECLDDEKQLYDVIFDATGNPKAFEQGYKYLDNGGKYIMYGCCPWDSKATINPFELFEKEISVLGAKTSVYTVIKSIWYIYTMTPRYVTFDKMGVKTFALKDYEKALEAMKSASVTKSIFKMT